MSYVSKTLLAGESILYKADLHWWIFASPIFLLVFSLLFVFGGGGSFYVVFGIVLVIVSAWLILKRIILMKTSEHVVTNKRVILKKGFIQRTVSDLQLHKAEAIVFKESILGRVLGYATILVATGGVCNTYSFIASPTLFRDAINNAIDNAAIK